jgi:hypothetical protein
MHREYGVTTITSLVVRIPRMGCAIVHLQDVVREAEHVQ